YEVGTALLHIKDHRLYREDYASFEDYCRDRWNFGRHRGYQLMNAATVADNLLTIVTIDDLPASESQARELVKLTPDAQRKVWSFITSTFETSDITAGMVKALAETMQAVIASGAIEDGEGGQVSVSDLFTASVQDYAEERRAIQKARIEENSKREKVATLDGDVTDLINQLSSLPSDKTYRVIVYADKKP
ncbi:hypothetical protein KC887_09845, partial [Candidatus Kaiserbacteria bacterium]|nr:hypothetical protein [Candidatus Kaiserbacteria bacterium]